MLGDEAVAVNPTDPRYQSIIGKIAILPLFLQIVKGGVIDPRFDVLRDGAVRWHGLHRQLREEPQSRPDHDEQHRPGPAPLLWGQSIADPGQPGARISHGATFLPGTSHQTRSYCNLLATTNSR